MKVEIKVPQQGLTVDYITFSSWKVSPGDAVNKGDAIAQIESEKAVLEIEAPESGKIIEFVAEPGEEYQIGEVLAYLETEM
ncbi:MAG: lipoyl domain-containing protein [Eubacteriales bacterium]|nr:lipoyl domain-containing protein [Eubacteriales bacterium]